MMKQKYNAKMQDFPCLTLLIKGYDTKGKANIFDDTEIKSFMLRNMESSYWLVRQAISIIAFFMGLCLTECHDLLEKMVRNNDGYKIPTPDASSASNDNSSIVEE
jgi:hypothetical protein